jgi:UDP-glucose 4-epimerase
MNKKILVTGGSGYIGSHTIIELINNGYEVISIDDNSRSLPNIYDKIEKITNIKIKSYEIDLKNEELVRKVFEENPDIDSIIHFAAYKSIEESIREPILYYENNLVSLFNLLKCCTEFNIKNFIFSSSCTVYGTPDMLPVTEETLLKMPKNPYGFTKQMSEQILRDYSKSSNVNVCLLRYFNPAGAHPSLLIGEMPHKGVLSLVSAMVKVATNKIKDKLKVYGNDYNTKDGYCIRDFIHVSDISSAHVLAIKYMNETKDKISVFNLGRGSGNSVLEVIQSFEKVTGEKLNYEVVNRREGDIEAIYCDNTNSVNKLNWKIKYDLDDIVKTAYLFEKNLI